MSDMRELLNTLETINESSYWGNSGKYEEQANELEALVPDSGPADTHKGELMRAASKIYYDFHNNGFGNNWAAPAQFLMDNLELSKKVMMLFYEHGAGNIAYGKRDATVESMMDQVVEQIYKMDDAPNTTDMWDTPYDIEDFYVQDEEDEEDEWDY